MSHCASQDSSPPSAGLLAREQPEADDRPDDAAGDVARGMPPPAATPVEDAVRAQLAGLPRIIGRVGPHDRGPTLICIGGLHGNEPAGVLALQQVVPALERDPAGLQGQLVALVGNRKSLAVNQRFLVDDLNRAWLPERLERVRASTGPLEAEDEELQELDRVLRDVLAGARGRISVIDVHSTSGKGGVFTTLDDTLANRRLAFSIPSPHVLGLEEELAGTLLGHLVNQGITAVGFESGQHTNPDSVRRAAAAIWIALEASGVLRPGSRHEVRQARAFLEEECLGLPGVVEVRHRHHVRPEDGFVMKPGFRNFQWIGRGMVVASDRRGAVESPIEGVMLMPLYQGQGSDGFFIVRPVHPVWLTISARLRQLGADRFVHWLPGVSRDPAHPREVVVDLRCARWLALQLFHLLGYKRLAQDGHLLRLRRRDNGQHPRTAPSRS